MAVNQAKVVTVTSVKGGTGKTMTVLNLAGAIANLKKKTLVIDLDLSGGSVAAWLNINPQADIYLLVDDINNNRMENIENYVTKYNDDIDVLAAPKDPRYANKIYNKYVYTIISKFALRYDVILIDTSHTMNDIKLVALDASDMVLYVISSDPMDLKNMKTMVSIHENLESNNYRIILNEALNRGRDGFSNYDIKNIIKHDIDYVIPDNLYIKNINKVIMDGEIPILNTGMSNRHKKDYKVYQDIIDLVLKEEEK